ncbi:hypothetical protein NE865_09154 [Phthorimaea operculella]|nr:hypothetical protein NE865_09154 [Phthorimaea operculella]
MTDRPEGQRDQREDARAAVSHQQMRSGSPRYPVDRYLVESSNKIEMVNIIEDDLWNPEPALRPEDELVLRRLHDMLHSTAEDLRQLTADLALHRHPPTSYQLKAPQVPLDEHFNDKVHIEQLVDAKFHGQKIIDTPIQVPNPNLNVTYSKPNVNTGVQADSVPVVKKPTKNKNLVVTRTRTLDIDEKLDKNAKNKLNNGKIDSNKVLNNAPKVAEFTYKYEEPKVTGNPQNKLKIQDMPRINIRSELKEQKVLQLDIYPEMKENAEDKVDRGNVAVVAAKHETEMPKSDPIITLSNKITTLDLQTKVFPQSTQGRNKPVRKVTKMTTCESSASSNNVSSDAQHNLKTQKQIKTVMKSSPKMARSKTKRTNIQLDDWKRKLNVIYGQPSTSKSKQIKSSRKSPKPPSQPSSAKIPVNNLLNNAEYIPYSKLTLGGARVSDVERELSNMPHKSDIPLSPILDKILSSRENSFHKESPKRIKKKESPRIFTTSDENLLEEVMDLEKTVSKTINKNMKVKVKLDKANKPQSISSESKDEEEKNSYADDFEEEKSDNTDQDNKEQSNDSASKHESGKSESDTDNNSDNGDRIKQTQQRIHDQKVTKKLNLCIKNSVDIFEFVHSVDTQDTATQSNSTSKISLKETQTSPRNERANINPIHNDLWPIDPKGEVEKLFQLEKDFIKKLLVEEYGDLIAKPSTSKDDAEDQKNVAASVKLTQTSPARVKSVMTSPARTKTRTTSPFLSVSVDHQTSPMVVVTNEEHFTVEVENVEDCISINLSSPRFSLRLPNSSREVLSNLEGASVSPTKKQAKKESAAKSKTYRKNVSSSSSEIENSSEMSSLGEIRFRLKKKYKRRVSSISEPSEVSSESQTSSDLPSGGIIPMRSEGEVSFKQIMRKGSKRTNKSEGEASIERTK